MTKKQNKTSSDNEQKLLKILCIFELWRPAPIKTMNKLMGFKSNKSTIRILKRLIKKGIIDKQYRPISKELKLDMSGTKQQ